MSFLMLEAERRFKKSTLKIVEELVNWKEVRKIVGKLDRRGYGPKGYEVSGLVKNLLLQAWHHLTVPIHSKTLQHFNYG